MHENYICKTLLSKAGRKQEAHWCYGKETLTQLSVLFYSSSVRAVEREEKTTQEAVSRGWLNPLVVSPALIVTE